MSNEIDRRELLQLMSVGGVVFASSLLLRSLGGCSSATSSSARRGAAGAGQRADEARAALEDFFFLQLSDTHWGFSGPMVNPNADVELRHAVAAINASAIKPDFVIFTGDLTHTTDDATERRRRMTEFKQIVGDLDVPLVKFMPGEHDAAADAGAVYSDIFGDMHYSFDHKGIHFVALDNVSDPMAKIGDAQLAWLKADLQTLEADTPIVVFAHRPLWDLKPAWDWATVDGAAALEILMPYPYVTVFFGHIHQTRHHTTDHIQHHAAQSLMFALPAPETEGMRMPVPWDASMPEKNLGYRRVEATPEPDAYTLTELPLAGTGDAG
jgi:hypothetical protein